MKHVYIEVSDQEYGLAKEIGFFEVTDFLRTEFRKFLSEHKENTKNGNRKQY